MNYIKEKFSSGSRSYTYRTVDDVKAGDTVVTANGAKLTVTDGYGMGGNLRLR